MLTTGRLKSIGFRPLDSGYTWRLGGLMLESYKGAYKNSSYGEWRLEPRGDWISSFKEIYKYIKAEQKKVVI